MKPFLTLTLIAILTMLSMNGFTQNTSHTTLRGHTGWVRSVAYSPDGETLATGSADKTIRLWDTSTGTHIKTLYGHTDDVLSVAYSPDGETLATGSADKTIRLWDTSTGTHIKTLRGHTDTVRSVAYSPDGETLASGSVDWTIRLWDTSTGIHLKTLRGHTGREGQFGLVARSGPIGSVAYSPDGSTLAAGAKTTMHLWDASTGELLKNVFGHTDAVRSIVYSPDGSTLATGSYDSAVRLWNASTGTHIKNLLGHTDRVLSVAYSPDGETLASGSVDSAVRLWDASTGTHIKNLLGHTDAVISVAYSPDGGILATGGEDHTVRLWELTPNTNTDTTDTTVSLLPDTTLLGHTDAVISVAYSPDGETLATGSADKTIRLWDASTGTHIKTLRGHVNWVRSVAYSPDGSTLASGSADNTVRLWDASTGRFLKTLRGHTDTVRCVAYSPDGSTLASGSADNTVRLWNASTGRFLKTLRGKSGAWWIGDFWAVAYSPDGSTLAAGGGDDTIALWDASTGKFLKRLSLGASERTGGFRSVAYSPDGSTLASGTYPLIHLWDAGTGELLKTLRGHVNWVRSIVYSPDGETLATGSYDSAVRLWDASTGTHIKTLLGHTGEVISVAYSPDGETLATGSADHTVRLWKLNPSTSSGADLVVEAVQADPATLAPGEEFKLRATLKNQGNVESTATTFRYLKVSDDPHRALDDTFFSPPHDTELAAVSRDPLAPNETLWGYLTVTAPTEPGTYYYVACVDSIPGESDTGNNCSEVVSVTVVGTADVNKDGVVNLQDLRLIALNLGKKGQNPADVNGDEVVDGADILLVLGIIEAEAAAAPVLRSEFLVLFTVEQMQQWLVQNRLLADKSPAYQRGIQVLEQLLALLTPKETALLPNYPNPFNPETWIPYHLAAPADVSISIWTTNGQLVRKLELGHQPVGIYESRRRAAYWDGKNNLGESVASGLYFYTLTAGDFTATRRMLILK